MAKSKSRTVFKYFSLVLTTILVVAYLLGCLSIWFSPSTYWILGFMGIAYPYTCILLILVIVFWLIAKPKIALFLVLILLVGYKQFAVMIGTNTSKEFNITNHENSLRVATWNIQGFNGVSKNKEAKKLAKLEIERSILKYNPDVVCLQEFNTTNSIGNSADNISLFKKHYPFYFFSADYERKKGNYQSGCIIFSKLPIVATNKIKYPIAESLISADIVRANDTIRIFTTHLQSFKFKKEDYEEIDGLSANDASVLASMSFVRKMKLAFKRRAKQTIIVKKYLQLSPYPTIICGDFNDVPNSNTYHSIKGKMQDAFLQTQLGFGKTFISFAPTLRIDYILYQQQFTVKQFEMVDENLSDHLMLVSDLELK